MWLGFDGATVFLCTCRAAEMRSAESSSIGEPATGEEPSRTIAAHTCAHRHPDSGWLHGVKVAYLAFGLFGFGTTLSSSSSQPATGEEPRV